MARSRILVVVLAGASLLAGCGGSSAADTGQNEEAAPAEQEVAPTPTEEPEPPTTAPDPPATALPEPTATPQPTAPPEPTATPSPFIVQRTTVDDSAETSLRPTATNELTATVYDRVVPERSGVVGVVDWQGVYTFCRIEDTEARPHATAFDIGFHFETDAGEPDLTGAFFSVTVAVTDTSETRQDDTVQQPCKDFQNDSVWSWYEYTASLEDGPTLTKGEAVWVSIRAVAPSYEPYWGWRSTFGGNASRQLFNGTLTPVITGARAISLAVAGG